MNETVPAEVQMICRRIGAAGGRPTLVGGAVIDMLQGRVAKDWDLEVFKMSFADMEDIFSDLRVDLVGKRFGVMKVSVGDVDIDINVPRRDNNFGVAHTDIMVDVDPSMTPKEAARRRDFTINAMSVDMITGVVEDHFGGMHDLESGVLRVTDPALFVQDPLRALRGMQLLARKAKTVDPATMMLIRSMKDMFSALPKERVFTEFEKLMEKAPKPSVGLSFLRDSGWIEHFPELMALIGCEQRAEWHPEGDVWTHSLLASDAAAEIRHLIPEHQRVGFMFGATLHDVGKPEFTVTQEQIDCRDPIVMERAKAAGRSIESMLLTAHGHDVGGEAPAEAFMRRLTNNNKLIKLVKGIVGLHMQPWSLFSGNARKGGFARLHRKAQEIGGDLALMGRMCQCDSCATGTDRSLASGEPNWDHASSARLFDFVSEFEADTSATVPKVQGRDLIAAGMKPGKIFGRILADALDLQEADDTLSKEEIMTAVCSIACIEDLA